MPMTLCAARKDIAIAYEDVEAALTLQCLARRSHNEHKDSVAENVIELTSSATLSKDLQAGCSHANSKSLHICALSFVTHFRRRHNSEHCLLKHHRRHARAQGLCGRFSQSLLVGRVRNTVR